MHHPRFFTAPSALLYCTILASFLFLTPSSLLSCSLLHPRFFHVPYSILAFFHVPYTYLAFFLSSHTATPHLCLFRILLLPPQLNNHIREPFQTFQLSLHLIQIIVAMYYYLLYKYRCLFYKDRWFI